jgi:hypothetical protein
MKTIRIRSWDAFGRTIEKLKKAHGTYRKELDSGDVFEREVAMLYRGEADASWHLKTTLERKTTRQFDVFEYLHLATRNVHEIESFTGHHWNIPAPPELERDIGEKQDPGAVNLPCYDYLVYLRHHGFPSPLLDWTSSPYIAAYFAYLGATKNPPAVYCYVERPNLVKSWSSSDPRITVFGPFVTTHKRHFAQKAAYTIATRWRHAEQKHYFCPHEAVFAQTDERQDLLVKIILPPADRRRALRSLDEVNINHFTLYQSEDSLIAALASREFDLKGS